MKQKILIGSGCFILVIILAVFFLSPKKDLGVTSLCPQKTEKVIMVMEKDAFTPTNLEIKRCTTVVFKNNDTISHWPASDIHPTHDIYPEFDPKKGIPAGSEWQFTFDKRGKWRYHDHLYPLTHGVITVY